MELDDYIVKFLEGACSPEEERNVLERAEEDPDFRQDLIELKNIHVCTSMPHVEASDDELETQKRFISQKEIDEASGVTSVSPVRKNRIPGLKYAFWFAAAAVIVILLFDIHRLKKEMVASQLASVVTVPQDNLAEPMHTLYTAKGVKGEVLLPDSSKVILNSDSRISYPNAFCGEIRDVSFTGEGYFQVRKDSLHPMVIHCNRDFKVVVYGTTFNIKSYENDDNSRTTLISGQVKIVENRNGSEKICNLVPNQTYVIGKMIEEEEAVEEVKDVEKVSQWKDGILSFESTPLCEAAKILERWHGVNIFIANPELRNIPITASFTTESMVQILDLLKFSTSIDYEIKDKNVTIK